MSGPVVDEAVCARARDAMVAARRAEHAVLEAVRELEAAGVAQAAGYRSLEGLVQDLWRVDRGEARRLLRHARALCGSVGPAGEPVEAGLPAAGKAAAAGGLDRGHVRVIDEAMRYLERVDGIDPAALSEAEEFLVEHAAGLAPRGLAKVAARVIAALDPDGLAPDEEPEPTDELRLARRRDGSLVLKGRFRGRADIELLCDTFDALSGRAGADDTRDLALRYAETLLDLCATAGGSGGIAAEAGPESEVDPTDTCGPVEREDPDPRHQPDPRRVSDQHADPDGVDQRGDNLDPASDDDRLTDEYDDDCEKRRVPRAPGRPLFTITMPLTWLQHGIGHGLLSDDTPISPAEARRLACDAGVIPALLGTRAEPLDVGRISYAPTDALRRALVLRDRGCSFPGCRRRPGRCHAHHVHHWLDGGPTALATLTLLCRFHHHLVHHGGWHIEMRDGRPWYTPPRWIDPRQLARPGGPVPHPS
jgi:hypothetical protein